MTRNSILAVGIFVASQIAWSPTAWAQAAPPHEWSHGTMLSVSAGTATAPSTEARPILGTALGWEINHWASLEGTGTWVVARQENEAFAAELKVLANLMRPKTIVPFVGAGVGLFRATFDTAGAPLPAFYKQRLTDSVFSARQTFTDPSFVFAAGVNVFTGQHVSIRPDVSVRLVTANADAYAVTMAAVHVTYHFGAHGTTR